MNTETDVTNADLKVALAHDYLTQRGGAERVTLALTRAFPSATLYTSSFLPSRTFEEFREVDVRTSFIQHLPIIRSDPRRALPILAPAWGSLKVNDADVLVASSSGWAHGVSASPKCVRIVYCHNPARWLYQRDEYVSGRLANGAMNLLGGSLRAWDRRAAARSDVYLANSSVVAERIYRAYGIEAEIVHPPVSVDVRGQQDPVNGISPGFWLTVGRSRGYKNAAAIASAVANSNVGELVVLGAQPGLLGDAAASPRVRCLSAVSEAQLRWLYTNARGLVSVSSEDFGLTPIEANAFGTPVAVIRAGGFLDSTAEGVSGVFIEDSRMSTIASTLRDFPEFESARVIAHSRQFSEGSFISKMKDTVSRVAVER